MKALTYSSHKVMPNEYTSEALVMRFLSCVSGAARRLQSVRAQNVAGERSEGADGCLCQCTWCVCASACMRACLYACRHHHHHRRRRHPPTHHHHHLIIISSSIIAIIAIALQVTQGPSSPLCIMHELTHVSHSPLGGGVHCKAAGGRGRGGQGFGGLKQGPRGMRSIIGCATLPPTH